jgi:hypothetical protein
LIAQNAKLFQDHVLERKAAIRRGSGEGKRATLMKKKKMIAASKSCSIISCSVFSVGHNEKNTLTRSPLPKDVLARDKKTDNGFCVSYLAEMKVLFHSHSRAVQHFLSVIDVVRTAVFYTQPTFSAALNEVQVRRSLRNFHIKKGRAIIFSSICFWES